MSPRGSARTILGVLSLLVIGGVLGVTADRTLHGSGGRAPVTDHFVELQEDLHERALSDFQERLRLDEGQRRDVDSVFRRHQSSVDRAWNTLRPQVQSAVDSVHAHIESILRPDQRAAFRDWLASQAGGEMDLRHLPAPRE